jgi:hypothetical protein
MQVSDLLHQIKNTHLIDNLIELDIKYTDLLKAYKILEDKNKELTEKLKNSLDECNNLNKVSYVKSLSLELTQKNSQIKQLEAQLDKFKIKPIKKEFVFNEEEFTDIDGYELLLYKNVYYLKNETTCDIYDINNYKPNNKVGVINDKGKIKLK